jgi:acetyl-CoA synthetase (ADP-forming)
MLGINSDDDLQQAYRNLLENVRKAAPQIEKPPVLVQKMMPSATELVLGAVRDPLFGPAIMFGLGGIFVEAMRMVGFRLTPLNREDAKSLMVETLPDALVGGFRGRSALNLDSIAGALVSLSRLMQENPQIDQVDLNPFLPDDDGGMAVDARIIIKDGL